MHYALLKDGTKELETRLELSLGCRGLNYRGYHSDIHVLWTDIVL